VDGHRTRGLTLQDTLNYAGNVICVSATTRRVLHGWDCFGRRAHTDFASRIDGIDVYVHVYGCGGNLHLHLGLDLMEIEGLFVATIDIRYFALTETPIAHLF
jgi:hypothetical protein